MDLSALERAARASERSLDGLGFWLFFFTALVVIGLIAEYRHEVVEFWEEVRRPAAMFPWQKFWAITGGVLVTIGVAGELIIGIKSSREETNLRNTNHQIEGLLNDKASANEREAEQLRKDAEALKSDNLKLQALIQPRTISVPDRKKLGEALHKFAPSFKGRKVKILSQIGDAEGMVFALEIVDILSRAGIDTNTDGMGRIEWIGAIAFGVKITGPIRDRGFIKFFAGEIATRANTDATGESTAANPETIVGVGVKPIAGLLKDWVHP